jgi:hypothetical protein
VIGAIIEQYMRSRPAFSPVGHKFILAEFLVRDTVKYLFWFGWTDKNQLLAIGAE